MASISAVSPSAVPNNACLTVTLTGSATAWQTTAPVISLSGVSDASAGAVTVVSNTSAKFLLTTGAAGGTLTITDTANGLSTTLTVAQFAQTVSDAFGRADTSAGSAGSTTGLGNGWIDRLGGVASLSGGKALLSYSAAKPAGDFTGPSHVALRPAGENAVDQMVVFDVVWPDTSASAGAVAALRVQTDSAGNLSLQSQYACAVSRSGAVQIERQTHYLTTFALGSSATSFTPTVGHTYRFRACAINVNPTTLLFFGRDLTADPTETAAPAVQATAQDFKYTLQQAGQSGFGLFDNNTGATGISQTFARVATYAGQAAGALTAPTRAGTSVGSFGGNTAVGAELLTPYPTGGTPPYTVQWQRGTSHASYANLSGATAPRSFDAAQPAGVVNFSLSYRAVWTDGLGASVTGPVIDANTVTAKPPGGPVYLGDSIAYGYGATTPTPPNSFCNFASAALAADTGVTGVWAVQATAAAAVNASNGNDFGVPGDTSGQYIGQGLHLQAVAKALDLSYNVAVVLFGTNNAKDSVATSAAQFKADLLTIKAAFVSAGFSRFMFIKPPWFQPGAYSSDFSAAGLARVLSYAQQIDTLADGTSVVVAPSPYLLTYAADYPGTGQASTFPPAAGKSLLADGLHPNDQGHAGLGKTIAYPAVKAALLSQWTPAYSGGAPRRPR